MQQITPLDHIILNFDHGLRTLFGHPLNTTRPNPAKTVEETELSDTEKLLSARLMRVNHAGEVSMRTSTRIMICNYYKVMVENYRN